MRPTFSLVAGALFVLLLVVGKASAEDTGSFGKFIREPLSPPKGAQVIDDPTGNAPTPKIYAFQIPSGYCNPTPYFKGRPENDCKFQSVRSQYFQSPNARQPKESWYGWYMYFPKDFAYGLKQPQQAFYNFAYWHNRVCQHMTISHQPGFDDTLELRLMQISTDGSCLPRMRARVANFKDIVDKWTRFEVHVKWSAKEDGITTVFVNGNEAAKINGPNLIKKFEKVNYFKFGVYLCCTGDVNKIRPTGMYYAGVKRAKTREELALKP